MSVVAVFFATISLVVGSSGAWGAPEVAPNDGFRMGIWASKETMMRTRSWGDCGTITEFQDGRPPVIQPPFAAGPGAKPKPFTYREPITGVTLHVQDDGRHLKAVDRNGKQLWVRNPFVDGRLCPYRTGRPIIKEFGPSIVGTYRNKYPVHLETYARSHPGQTPKIKTTFIVIHFDSSQSGYVDMRNGDFFDLGQN